MAWIALEAPTDHLALEGNPKEATFKLQAIGGESQCSAESSPRARGYRGRSSVAAVVNC